MCTIRVGNENGENKGQFRGNLQAAGGLYGHRGKLKFDRTVYLYEATCLPQEVWFNMFNMYQRDKKCQAWFLSAPISAAHRPLNSFLI